MNLDEGARIFDFSLRAIPKDPGSGFFDALEIEASGLGGDPQQWAHLNLRRHGVYRWDLKYDRSEYFFSVPDFALGQHTNDNLRQTLDSLLEFHPGKSRVYLGFARREFDGPAFLTQDFARDEFLVFAPADRQTDDARAGIDFPLGRWALNLEQGYRKLETLSEYELPSGSGAGNNPGNNSTLSSFLR
ncbi:MAG: hypothetical protein HY509_01370, partial [Acidobacteria bacterium]|nr:hypothetical protein [Acidobacteriota bacterium]